MNKGKNESKKKKCYAVKIIIVGDQSVGKTNLINRYVKGEFSEDYMITIGMDFLTCNLELEDKIFKLRLWDTAGSERFRSVTKGYYSNSCCAIIVYDITDQNSFNSVKQWIEDCQSYASKNIHLILVGNKIDLKEQRKVNKEDAKSLSEEYGMDFFETSAKSGENIDELFLSICKNISRKIDEGKYDFKDPSFGVSIANYEEGMEINKTLDLNSTTKYGDSCSHGSKCC